MAPKNSSKLNKFLLSEVNQLIQHIIVQDQVGQNNNTDEYVALMTEGLQERKNNL